MATILVVDDSEVDRKLVGGLLERSGQWTIEYACDGGESLERVAGFGPEVVLTDLQMPRRDGLQLVTAMRLHHPGIPVILMTGHGSEQLAVDALDEGAASYVPKSQLAEKLLETVQQVWDLARADRTYERLIQCLRRTEFTFELDNDPALIPALVDLLQQMACGMGLCDANGRLRLGVALNEALCNALYRGNLEIGFADTQQQREALLQGQGVDPVEQRRGESPYRERKIRVNVSILPEEARFVVRDEGPGFNPGEMPAAALGEENEEPKGRGLHLIRAFMDEVSFNDTGNEITMVKRGSAC